MALIAKINVQVSASNPVFGTRSISQMEWTRSDFGGTIAAGLFEI